MYAYTWPLPYIKGCVWPPSRIEELVVGAGEDDVGGSWKDTSIRLWKISFFPSPLPLDRFSYLPSPLSSLFPRFFRPILVSNDAFSSFVLWFSDFLMYYFGIGGSGVRFVRFLSGKWIKIVPFWCSVNVLGGKFVGLCGF